jgi:hypothetical protein
VEQEPWNRSRGILKKRHERRVATALHCSGAEELMSGSVLLRLIFVSLAAVTLTGCELIGDIFQAGMAVGIFLVIAAIALITYLVATVRRRV